MKQSQRKKFSCARSSRRVARVPCPSPKCYAPGQLPAMMEPQCSEKEWMQLKSWRKPEWVWMEAKEGKEGWAGNVSAQFQAPSQLCLPAHQPSIIIIIIIIIQLIAFSSSK